MSYDPDDDFGPRFSGRPPARSGSGDLSATIALLAIGLMVGAAFSFAVLLTQMNVAACSADPSACDFALVGLSTWVVPAATIIALVASSVALARRGRTGAHTWWIPLVGIVLEVIAFIIAIALIDVAIPR